MNRCLEEPHEDDDKGDEVAEENVEPKLVWEQAAEVKELESEMTDSSGYA